ncbi:hypothetical protein ABBQ32_011600, partial [Trebouxia sp. C0010 RCD-2024]
ASNRLSTTYVTCATIKTTFRYISGRHAIGKTLSTAPGPKGLLLGQHLRPFGRRLSGRQPNAVAMRAVIQRVKSASVTVDGDEVSRIGAGVLCLVGVRVEDGPKDADFICRRILNSRLFTNQDTGRNWDESVVQQGKEVLCVSQFTLFNIMKGNKPDFHLAMGPIPARAFYDNFVKTLRDQYSAEKVQDGKFGALMEVSLVNDGPITIILDSEAPKG